MISFTLKNISLVQIEQSLSKMHEHWRKVRGWGWWGSRLKLVSQVNRRVQNQHLILREWEITLVKAFPTIAAVIWIDSDLEGCEVFLTCPRWMDEKFVRIFIMALLKIDDPSQVDVSSYLTQNQT